MVVIKQGGTAEAALDATDGTIDSKTKTPIYSRCTLVQGIEVAVEQSYIDQKILDSRGRGLRCLNRRFVSRRGASLDPGTDIRLDSTSIAGCTWINLGKKVVFEFE